MSTTDTALQVIGQLKFLSAEKKAFERRVMLALGLGRSVRECFARSRRRGELEQSGEG